MTPAVGKHLDALIGSSLEILSSLMTATPQVRLVVPAPGTHFDSTAHLARGPVEGESLIVRAVLFPGLRVLETPTRIIEPVLVLAAPRAEPKADDESEK